MTVTISQIYETLQQYEKDNYYLRDTEPQRFGDGWQKLGLEEAKIDAELYKKLAAGQDLQGNQLVRDVNGHRAGYNITFSPHKSFSVAAFSSQEMKAELMEAHRQAVSDTLQYLEQNLSQVRERQGGDIDVVKTGNIVGFTVEHQVSRDGDVQIHTHAVLFNMSYNENKGWQALHSDAFKSNVLEKVYENQLAHYLREKGFSVEWKQSESGKSYYAAVAGVPKEAIEATSQRAQEIKNALSELQERYQNATVGELKQIAAYETRNEKKSITLEQIQNQFEKKLSDIGISKQDIVASIEQAKQELQKQAINKMNAADVVKQAYNVISEQKAVFTKTDILKAALDISKGDVKLHDIEKAIDTFLRSKNLIKLAEDMKIKEASRSYADTLYTTKSNLLAEKNIYKMVEQGKDKFNSIYTAEQAQKEIQKYEDKFSFHMTNSQREAVKTALTTKDFVTLFQGYAGTGKTTVLSALKDIASQQGYKVFGVSETNVAVQEIKANQIESHTVTKFLNTPGLQSSINDKTLIIVDEASFMGAKNMQEVLKVAQEHGARVLLFGDKNQLPPISAAYPFRDLQEKGITVVEMKDIVRQTNAEFRDMIKDVVNKDIEKAFSKLDVVEIQNKEQLVKAATEHYVKSNGYKDTIISTYTNADKNKLNESIRSELQEKGIVSKENHTFTVYTPKNLQGAEQLNIFNYKVGDKLVAQKAGAGVKVGAELTITHVDLKNHTVIAQQRTKAGIVEKSINVRHFGNYFNAYAPETKNFAVGDKIIFNANLKQEHKHIVNSEVGYIKAVNGNKITVSTGQKTITFDASRFKFFDHGYASTTYKAQGKTSQKAIYFAPTEKNASRSYQDFYVAISRGKTDAKVYTDNKAELKEQVSKLAEKESITTTEQKLQKSFDSIYSDLVKGENKTERIEEKTLSQERTEGTERTSERTSSENSKEYSRSR